MRYPEIVDKLPDGQASTQEITPEALTPEQKNLQLELRIVALEAENKRLREENKRLQELAVLDNLLPGFFNHKYFLKLLETELQASQKNPTSAYITMDLDNFGAFNNQFGHPTGDKLLLMAGEAILGSMRRGDTPGRIGGDEFGLIIRRTTLDGAVAAARRIQTATIRATQKKFGQAGWIQTISAGVCMIDPQYPFDLLREVSDQALYKSKEAGKNRISIGTIDPLSKSVIIRAVFSNTPAAVV